MATKKTTEEFNKEVQAKYGTDISVYGEYLGAQRNVSLICNNGHIWETLATNLISRGSRSFCNICRKGIYNRVIDWNSDNVAKLNELTNRYLTLEQIAKTMECSTNAILNACTKFNIRRPRVDTTIAKLCNILVQQDREIISPFEDIVTSDQKVTIKCAKGHIHEQNIYNIINDNTGCPSCVHANGTSIAEKEILAFISSRYKGKILNNQRTLPNNKEIDIILPDLKLGFEYNGVWWHREDKVGSRYHLDKQNNARIHLGINLVHIFEDEWELKKDIVKSRIDSMLGNNLSVYARNCTVKSVQFPKEFLDNNHIQGSGSPTKYNYGIFNKDILIGVMTFSSSRFDSSYDYELVRYCSLTGINIVGGASKLLKAFRKEFSGSIITYSDKRWSTGNMYKALGFSYLRTSEPGYKYYKKLNSFSRFQFQKHKLEKLFPNSYSDELTEAQIMKLEGYHRVYDCGNDVWVL
jgi:hypothetical protein